MTDADRHWRYGLAAMLILSCAILGGFVIFHPVPEANQRMVDTLFGGLITVTGNAVLKAIDAARSVEDAATINRQSSALAASTSGPSGAANDPIHVEPQ